MKKLHEFKKACASVILHDGNDNIILGRSIKHADWETPGGKHELNETSQECAARECLEECGIDISLPLEFVCLSETPRTLCVNYAKKISRHLEPRVMEKKKHSEWRWFSIHDLPSPLRLECQEELKEWLARR